MYWLRKLFLYHVTYDDVDKHCNAIMIIFDKLNTLVTWTNPLTPDDIFVTALLLSVSSTWPHAVVHLLNSPSYGMPECPW